MGVPICGNIAGIDGQGGDNVVPVLNLTLVAEVAAVDAVVVMVAMLVLVTVALKSYFHDIIRMRTLLKNPGLISNAKKAFDMYQI
jgi:hypothetical protein